MKKRDEMLDLVRGISALLVLLAHIRAFLFKDLGELVNPGILTKAFYFVTGIHHQAVMVFFVLSGYFVGGAVCSQIAKHSFSAKQYAVARLSRLWMVLFPALLLTAACDWIGRTMAESAYSGGLRAAFMSGPTLEVPADLSPRALLGNLLFLQTIEFPVYGSNGPLWSLANEFWYYVLFPLFALGFAAYRKTPLKAVLCMVFAAALCWWLPRVMVSEGSIWLMGVLVWWLPPPAANRWLAVLRLVSSVAFIGSLAISKTPSMLGSDYSVGLCFAFWVWAWKGVPLPFSAVRRTASGLSDISYTLYVCHFPILFLIGAVWFRGEQFHPGWSGYVWFTGLTLLLLGIGGTMWFLFERRTDLLRAWLMRRIEKR